jgi:Flp pilus assembly protein TadD
MLEPVVRKGRENADALDLAATLHVQLSQLEEAARYYRRLVRIRPGSVSAQYNLATLYTMLGRTVDAVRILRGAIERFPGETRFTSALAEALMRQREFDEVERVMAPHMNSIAPDPYIVLAFARLCMRTGRAEDGERAVAGALQRGAPPDAVPSLHALHGDLLDGLGRFDDAFAAYRLAAEFLKPARPWDPDANTRLVDDVIAAWTPKRIEELHSSSVTGDLPVFIVGLPRSGTTLVEQILDRHPEFTGLGEIASFQNIEDTREPSSGAPLVADPARLTRAVIERGAADILRRWRKLGAKTSRASDKTPHNFNYVGVIRTIFPRARIIYCTRDPRDTGLSCYFQHFGAGNNWSFDLDHIAAYYRDHERLMNHWRVVFQAPMLHVRYEDVVSDIEAQTRRMLDFLGLRFHADCLAFHENQRQTHTASLDQVRQPLYASSVGRWKHYEKHLGPLADLA